MKVKIKERFFDSIEAGEYHSPAYYRMSEGDFLKCECEFWGK